MKRYALTFVVVALICSCAPAGRDVIRVEPNDLGITELEVRHDQVQDDRLLTLRGFDQDGTVIATAVLRTGMVMYGADVPEELHAGTELAVTVGQRTASFVSPDRVPHVIYDPLSPGVATFVRLSPVANEVFREAAIRFAPPKAPSDEVAFTAGTCSGSRFPTNKGGANQCCQDNANTYHVNPATLAVANRSTYAPVYPSIPVCRDSAGNTGCTTNCMYGPCGSAVISVKGTNGHVFVPTSNPNVCGWDDGGAGGLGVDYSPEHYTTQTLYGGMTATCQCTGCNSDGTPQCLAAQWKFNESNGTNLLSNPGLETWSAGVPTGWTPCPQSTITQSSTARSGSYSAQITDPDWKGIHQTVTTTQPSGTTFVGVAWVKWVSGATASPYLQLIINYSDGTASSYVGSGNSSWTTSGWYQLYKSYTVSHPVSSVEIWVVNNAGSSETFVVDDASIAIGGLTTADSSGNGNSGTLTGGTTFVAGKVGNAVELDGVNDYVAFGNPSVLSFGTTSFSYAMWVYEYSATPVGSADMPWWKGGNTAHVGFDMELGTGAWNACVTDAVTVKCSSFSSTPTYDAWVHLVAVVDRTAGQLKVYKNGAYVTQTALSTFGSVSSTWTAEVGAEYDSSKGIASPFHGKVDDVRMYNYALSDSEVSTLYNGGAGQP